MEERSLHGETLRKAEVFPQGQAVEEWPMCLQTQTTIAERGLPQKGLGLERRHVQTQAFQAGLLRAARQSLARWPMSVKIEDAACTKAKSAKTQKTAGV